MKIVLLTAERITELALKLAMLSSHRAIGLADLQFRQIEGALRWHRASCRPISLVPRIVDAAVSGRLRRCLALIAEQKAMLHMAADEGSDDVLVLDALIALSTAVVHYEILSSPTPKLRLALAACGPPAKRARLARLVRGGEIESTPAGLRLLGATRRRVAAYGALAMFIMWPGAIFLKMAIDGALSPEQLVGYLIGTVLISVWLTRGLFTALRSDERMVLDLNSNLRPQAAKQDPAGRPSRRKSS
jgi:hypothetical protein